MARPGEVLLTEVGLRDGFQMADRFVPTDLKVGLGESLIAAGLRRLEVTSFVSPRAVPQLADAQEVVARLKTKGARLAALAPNPRGAERAVAAGVDEIVVFVSASETHNFQNVNRTIAASLTGIAEMHSIGRSAGVPLCGAVATAFGCPFEGDVSVEAPLKIIRRYVELGILDISLGDTTGMATPPLIERLCRAIQRELPEVRLALHFHNTRGIGLVNVLTGLNLGVARFESSIAGLGGCPFAPGATGNVCSEDLVYLLQELDIATGIDLESLIAIARRVEAFFARSLPGQVMKAGPRLQRRP